MKWVTKQRIILVLSLIAVILIFLPLFLRLSAFLASDELRRYIEALGPFGPLALIFYLIASHVFAPLAGTPALVVGVAVFGLAKTMLYIYLGSIVSAVICFFISRKFGRNLVRKFAGKRAMNKIDDFSQDSGVSALIFARIFGVSLFEFISYAAGLSTMKFSTYFVITLIFHAIPTFVLIYVFQRINISSQSSLLVSLGAIMVLGVAFAVIFQFWQKRKRSRKE